MEIKSLGGGDSVKPVQPVREMGFRSEGGKPTPDTVEISNLANLLRKKEEIERQLKSLEELHEADHKDNEVRLAMDKLKDDLMEINKQIKELNI